MENIFNISINQSRRRLNLITAFAMLVAMLGSGMAAAQSFEWAKQAGGTKDDQGNAIAVDGSGNSYVTGFYVDSAIFGPGEINETHLVSSNPLSSNIFIARYDSRGDLVWARNAGGNGSDLGHGIAVDAAGNSYVTGEFSGSAIFGAGEANEITLVGPAFQEIFVAKYDPSGALLWARKAGGTGFEAARGIAVDTAGNSYVTGEFTGSAVFGAGEVNETTLNSPATSDIFVARYDGDGNLVWARQAGGANADLGKDIAADALGNSYVTGEFSGSAVFGAGEANQTTLVSAGFADVFLARYDTNGNLVWATRAGGSQSAGGEGVAVDSSGNSYVTGNFLLSATFGGGEVNETTLVAVSTGIFVFNDIFIAKYDGNGGLVWARQAGGSTLPESGFDIAVDGSGNSYVTGDFSSATFGVGEANETSLSAASGSYDLFIAKYASSGNLVWVTSDGGSAYEGGHAIAVDKWGGSYVTGRFSGASTFGAGGANATTLNSFPFSMDIFVARYAGDIPVCDIEMSQSVYTAGDRVTGQAFRLANPATAPVAVELKVWFARPSRPPDSVINHGADGSAFIPAGFDQDFGPFDLGSVTGAVPGLYEFSCRLLVPVTGELIVEDLNWFEIQ